MKGLCHGICAVVIIVLVFVIGCSTTGAKILPGGPVRSGSAISGDLTNADITITDWRLVVGVMGCLLVSVIGFVYLSYRLAAHHAAIRSIASVSNN